MPKRPHRFFTAQQAKAVDLKAKEEFGISTLVLMENAGRAVADEALKILRGKKSVAIFCGKGHNGGDGLVAARHLLAVGIKPEIFLAGRIADLANEEKINLEILLKLKQKIIEVDAGTFFLVKNKITKYGLIIDALLGVGLGGQVRGVYRDLIDSMNTAKVRILSVDIPSGLDATTGKILGCCVKADKTVTFLAKKRGMIIGEGRQYCGRVVVADLGIPMGDYL